MWKHGTVEINRAVSESNIIQGTDCAENHFILLTFMLLVANFAKKQNDANKTIENDRNHGIWYSSESSP